MVLFNFPHTISFLAKEYINITNLTYVAALKGHSNKDISKADCSHFAGIENSLPALKVIVLVISRYCFSGSLHHSLLHVSYIDKHNGWSDERVDDELISQRSWN